jgi:hypothetical protein
VDPRPVGGMVSLIEPVSGGNLLTGIRQRLDLDPPSRAERFSPPRGGVKSLKRPPVVSEGPPRPQKTAPRGVPTRTTAQARMQLDRRWPSTISRAAAANGAQISRLCCGLTGRLQWTILSPRGTERELFNDDMTTTKGLHQNSALPGNRGNGITSRMFSTPVTYCTSRSNPSPKPACGTEPYRRRSRYHQ